MEFVKFEMPDLSSLTAIAMSAIIMVAATWEYAISIVQLQEESFVFVFVIIGIEYWTDKQSWWE
jgi:hypothetical protein